jgi:serine phosphatase RsbU (regulator of sigma subunit)
LVGQGETFIASPIKLVTIMFMRASRTRLNKAFFPRTLLTDTPWASLWVDADRRAVTTGTRVVLGASSLALIAHHYLVDIPLGIGNLPQWLAFRFGVGGLGLLLLALTYSPLAKVPWYRWPLLVFGVAFSVTQAASMTWYAGVPYIYAMVVPATVAMVLRETPLNTAIFLVSVLAMQWPFLAQSGQDMAYIVSAAFVSIVCTTALRSRINTDIHAFVLTQEKIERDRSIKEDLMQAHSFHRKLVPSLPATQQVEFSVAHQAAEALGGDLYEVHKVAGDAYRLLLVDVAGHGVQACLRGMSIKTEYDKLKDLPAGPDGVLRELNNRLIDTYGEMAILYCASCTDIRRGPDGRWTLRHANAGQPAALLVRAAGIVNVSDTSSVQGIMKDVAYPLYDAVLEAGDRIILRTDGLADERNAAQEKFDEQRSYRHLTSGTEPLQKGTEQALNELMRFLNGFPLQDDVTVVAAQVH